MTPPSPYREQVVLHSTLQSAVPFVTITTLWLAAHGLAGSPSPHCRGGFRHGSASGPHACSPSHRPTPGRVPKPKRSTHALLGAHLAVLWDIRVLQECRRSGIGSQLFAKCVDWAKRKDCTRLKIETQNNNVPACRFYASMGCELRGIHHGAYSEFPDEVQFLWYLDL